MQTAMKEHIQWLYDNQLELNIPIEAIEDAENRLEMEKQQIIDAAERWKGTDFAEKYYAETYGSKGSDDRTMEEIEKLPY